MASNEKSKPIDRAQSSTEYLSCGYPVYDIEKIDHKWKCIMYCQSIIKEPIQFTECGHRCCKGCFESRAARAPDGLMVCPIADCETKFHKGQIMVDRAFKRELELLQVVCCYKDTASCPWIGLLKDYQEHLDQNHINFPCPKCQAQFSSCQALADHQKTSCPGSFMKCDLGPICGDKWIPIDHFDEHLLSAEHQEAINSILTGQSDVAEIIDQEQTMEVNTLDDRIEQETSEKLVDLADTVQKLNDDTVELSRSFVRLSELSKVASEEINLTQVAVIERNMAMSALQPKQDQIQKDIDQLKQNLEENQYISTDGTLTWRVDRVAERMADAQSERQQSIYSPVFYSSSTGYKMRARLYLHGDGNARRTHMSLFFLLMKGDYDALLSWPFGYKVTFCLFDQTGNNRHIIDSFRPDTKSNSFQRPKLDANIASGIPKFFPLPMIQQDDNPYVRDDTLFLKIIIDLTDTPKMILPYMLTLNPGLPHHVQQILINQEKAKRQQQQNTASTTAQSVPMNTCG